MKNLLLVVCLFASTTAISQQQDSAKFYFNKGVEENNAKRYLVASKHFDKAISFDPSYKEAFLQNALVNVEMRKTDIAKAHFTKVNELDPQNQVAIRNLAELYFNYRQFAKAVEYAQKCKDWDQSERILAMSNYHNEDYGAAITSLKKVLAKNPNDAEVNYTLGRSYLDLEEYKNAVPFYVKAVDLETSRNAWAYELGLLYYNINDFKSAAVYFNKAAENGYPTGNDFNENLGYAYIYSGEFDNGEKLLLAVLNRKPGNKDILRDMAQAYYSKKMYDKSLDYCQKLMEMDMKDAKALYQAGLCFQKKGEKERGQQMCDKAIEIDPTLTSMRTKVFEAGL